MTPATVSRLFTLVVLAASRLWAGAAEFALRDGDRVVFYGDSITDQRLYTTFTETYVVTRFPKMDVGFVHSGWGGDRVTGGGGGSIDVRLARDVVAYKPTVMTIMLGMNDGSYRAFDQGIFDTYARGYESIVASVRKSLPGIRITAIQPSPFDDVTRAPNFPGGYNEVLVRYGKFVADLAGREGLGVADLNGPVVAALEKAKGINAELAAKLIADRVHPGSAGQLLMAACLLKAWNAPAVVTSVEIDAAGKVVTAAERTRVTDLKAGGEVTWTQADEALPMPVDRGDSVIALAVKSSDFVETLNREMLKVTGLAAGNYTLTIDGEDVGTFGRDELAAGINLAMLATPMARQAAAVHQLTLNHNNVHFTRWRQVQVPMAKDDLPQVRKAAQDLMDALDEKEAGLVKQQRAAAQPKAHQYRLVAK